MAKQSAKYRRSFRPCVVGQSRNDRSSHRGKVIGASKIARDITERKRAEERQHLLFREMDHRIKNLFALAIAVVSLSGRSAKNVQDLVRSARERLSALARAHALTLSHGPKEDPQGTKPTTLHSLIRTIIAPHEDIQDAQDGQITIVGPNLAISGSAISSLAPPPNGTRRWLSGMCATDSYRLNRPNGTIESPSRPTAQSTNRPQGYFAAYPKLGKRNFAPRQLGKGPYLREAAGRCRRKADVAPQPGLAPVWCFSFPLFRNGSGAASSARAFVAPKDVGSTGGAGIESLASAPALRPADHSAPHGQHNALPTTGQIETQLTATFQVTRATLASPMSTLLKHSTMRC